MKVNSSLAHTYILTTHRLLSRRQKPLYDDIVPVYLPPSLYKFIKSIFKNIFIAK